MRCIGRKKPYFIRRCKNQCNFLFCGFHWYQPIFFLIAICSSIIWFTDLSEAFGLKKPIDYFSGSSKKKEADGSFNLTVFVHGPEGQQSVVIENRGKLILDLANDRKVATIGAYGRAVFGGIPVQFRNKKIKIGVETHGFVLEKPEKVYSIQDDKPIYLALKQTNSEKKVDKILDDKIKRVKSHSKPITCKVLGIVKYASNGLSIVGANVVVVCDSLFKVKTDGEGYFSIDIPQSLADDQCLIRSEYKGKSVEAYIPMCNPNLIELKLE